MIALGGLFGLLATIPSALHGHGELSARIQQKLGEARAHPEHPEVHVALSALYVEHEEWERAIIEIDRVDALAPGVFPVDCLRGTVWVVAQKPERALPLLDRFLMDYPENSTGHLQRARARFQLGQAEEGLRDFRAALNFGRQPEPDLFLEVANALTANGAIDEAVETLDRGVARLGMIPSLSLRALDLEVAAGRYDAALARLAANERTAPRPEPWMARRADLLAQARRPAEARREWQALLARLGSLSAAERGSHAMSLLSERAVAALRTLPAATAGVASTTSAPGSPRQAAD